jgi:hypothetical protein
MQPDPQHVNQFATGGPRGRYLCTAAVGAMALDAFTAGRIRTTAAEIDRNQDDHDTNGIGLDDVATAWRRGWGLTFSHGARSWGALMARWRAGDGAALQGRMAVVPRQYRTQVNFIGGHALYVSRQTRPGWLLVFDPIATAPREWPETVVQAFYLSGLALAGWGTGAGGATATAAAGQLVSQPDVRTSLAAYLGIPASTVVTDAHIRLAADRIATATGAWNRAFPVIHEEFKLYLAGHPGITAGAFPIVTNQDGTAPRSDDPTGNILALVGNVAGATGVGGIIRDGLLLAFVLALVLLGLYTLVRSEQ